MGNEIRKVRFKDGLNFEFEIKDLAKIYNASRDMMTEPHRAQFYQVLFIEKGRGTHYVDFKPIEIKDNSIVFVPQNSINLFDTNGEYEGRLVLFTDSFFCQNTHDLSFLNSTILFSDLYDFAQVKVGHHCSELKVTLNALETEFVREKDSAHYGILRNVLHVFLLQAERELRNQGFVELKAGVNLDYLMLFKDLLEKNFREEKSVNKYASELSISEKQLQKATKTLLDKTPKQIIDERILLEAKRLLVHGSDSIKEIAYDLGYDEPTNFIKYFRKHVACTPSEFREQQRFGN